MSAVARPTFVVVAVCCSSIEEETSCDDDDDESNEHLSYAVWIACGLFVILFLLFDLLRTRMWWVYEPRLHHDSHRARTPHGRAGRSNCSISFRTAVRRAAPDDLAARTAERRRRAGR